MSALQMPDIHPGIMSDLECASFGRVGTESLQDRLYGYIQQLEEFVRQSVPGKADALLDAFYDQCHLYEGATLNGLSNLDIPSVDETRALISSVVDAPTEDGFDYEGAMSLGMVLAHLKSLPPSAKVPTFCDAHSYRGYYECIGVQPTNETTTVAESIDFFKSINGQTYFGWKGGEFYMQLVSRVFIASEGSCGKPMTIQALFGR